MGLSHRSRAPGQAPVRRARVRAARASACAWATAVAAGVCALVATACSSTSGNGDLGQGTFTYVCAAVDPSAPGPDAYCDAHPDGATIPDVAVGAPFRLSFNAPSVTLKPAVAALASTGPQGWSLGQTGWLGFVAWSGSDVVDYTHVRARAVASIAWETDPAGLDLAPGVGPVTVAAIPKADDGTTLGGALACTFTASDLAVIAVTASGGRTAQIAAVGPGDSAFTASCAGLAITASVHVAAPADAAPAQDQDSDESGEGGE